MGFRIYRFGLLLVVFSGFIMINSDKFGRMGDSIGKIGIVFLLFGLIIGTFGLLANEERESR